MRPCNPSHVGSSDSTWVTLNLTTHSTHTHKMYMGHLKPDNTQHTHKMYMGHLKPDNTQHTHKMYMGHLKPDNTHTQNLKQSQLLVS